MPFESITHVPVDPNADLDALKVHIDWDYQLASHVCDGIYEALDELRTLRNQRAALGYVQHEAYLAERDLDETDPACADAIEKLRRIQRWCSGDEPFPEDNS